MEYYFSTVIKADFKTAMEMAIKELQSEGFGVVTTLDLKEKFKEKLGVDFKPYTILGACNPAYAYKALQSEERIGTMLPCNVLIIDRLDGSTEVTAVDPEASMVAIKNPALGTIAAEIREKLKKVIKNLQEQK